MDPTTRPPTPDLAAMAFHSPSTSFHPCPIRAADVPKPHPTPPPIYYLRDHVRVEYNDGDWETTPEGKEEASQGEEVNEYNHTPAAGRASMAVRARPPLSLLSVKMRAPREGECRQYWDQRRKDTEGGAVRFSRYTLCSNSRYSTHPRSRAICAGREGGYPARTTVRSKV